MLSRFLTARRIEIIVLFFILLFFIFSRFFNILIFPIFNDEGIYLQYSQLINQDFNKFKFISINNIFRDFKPPLSYWWGAIFLNFFDNPLLAGRVASVVFSVVGLFGIYWFCFNLWGKREALTAAFFYALLPPVLFYSLQFVAEVYVFSAGVLLFASVLSIMKAQANEWKIWSIIIALLSGVALLLFKQSGALYLYLLVFLPFFYLPFGWFSYSFKDTAKSDKDYSATHKKLYDKQTILLQRQTKEQWAKKTLIVFLIITFSFLFYKLIIPSELAAIEKQFTGRWTLSLGEILKLPFDLWLANWKIVKNFFITYYSLWALVGIIILLLFAVIKREQATIMTFFFFIMASALVVFGLRGFNEYIYNTAVVVFLIPLLARFTVLAFFDFNFSFNNKLWVNFIRFIIIFLVLAIVGHYSYQIFLMKNNPIKYLERGTDWLIDNYLISWANGFNIPDIMDFLANQKEKTIVFLDPQWGNPGTALQVFHKNFYPDVFLLPITNNLLTGQLNEEIQKAGFKKKFIIFSAEGNLQGVRNEWQKIVEQNFCREKLEFRKYVRQTPVIICSF